MPTLDPNARALVEAGRRALRASTADRERIEAALRARLGPSALPTDAGATQVASPVSWSALAGVAIGVCVLAGVAFVALRSTPSAPPRQPPSAVQRPASQPALAAPAPEVPAAVPEPVAPAHTVVAPAASPAAAAPRVRDSLAREVALLSRATSELRAGHAAAALKVLDEHRRRFPSGALSEERQAAKAQALCVLGRVSEGRVELAQLTPGSPAAASAQRICAGAVSVAGARK